MKLKEEKINLNLNLNLNINPIYHLGINNPHEAILRNKNEHFKGYVTSLIESSPIFKNNFNENVQEKPGALLSSLFTVATDTVDLTFTKKELMGEGLGELVRLWLETGKNIIVSQSVLEQLYPQLVGRYVNLSTYFPPVLVDITLSYLGRIVSSQADLEKPFQLPIVPALNKMPWPGSSTSSTISSSTTMLGEHRSAFFHAQASAAGNSEPSGTVVALPSSGASL